MVMLLQRYKRKKVLLLIGMCSLFFKKKSTLSVKRIFLGTQFIHYTPSTIHTSIHSLEVLANSNDFHQAAWVSGKSAHSQNITNYCKFCYFNMLWILGNFLIAMSWVLAHTLTYWHTMCSKNKHLATIFLLSGFHQTLFNSFRLYLIKFLIYRWQSWRNLSSFMSHRCAYAWLRVWKPDSGIS